MAARGVSGQAGVQLSLGGHLVVLQWHANGCHGMRRPWASDAQRAALKAAVSSDQFKSEFLVVNYDQK
jgi:hypothetical protein